MNTYLLTFLDLFISVANGLIVVAILTSWFTGLRRIRVLEALTGMAEVIMWPAKKLVPSSGPLDWSPLITLFALQIIQTIAHRYL